VTMIDLSSIPPNHSFPNRGFTIQLAVVWLMHGLLQDDLFSFSL
jgi:hypothetical protein